MRLMKTTVKQLNDVFQTGREMARLVVSYWADLGPWLGVDFRTYYSYVCALPYVEDPEEVETVSRPAYTLQRDYRPRDCDDKAVLIACWLYAHGIQCRFVASSTRPDRVLHHVFVQAAKFGYIDATFDRYAGTLGNYDYFPAVTNLEPLTGWI